MVLMEEENIKLFNKKIKKKNKMFQGRFPKSLQKRKNFEVVFQITIGDLKPIILKKDEEIQFF